LSDLYKTDAHLNYKNEKKISHGLCVRAQLKHNAMGTIGDLAALESEHYTLSCIYNSAMTLIHTERSDMDHTVLPAN